MSLFGVNFLLRRHSPGGLVRLAAARRVPPRRAGNFLLLAQKKVTKEEGLNTILPNICTKGSAVDGRRSYDHLSATWISPRIQRETTPSGFHFDLGPSTATPSSHVSETNRCVEALCFGYFHLCQQMFRRGRRLLREAKLAATKVTAGRAHRRAAAKSNKADHGNQTRPIANPLAM